MSSPASWPTAHSAVIAFALAAILGVSGLILAGATDQRSTAFALDVTKGGAVVPLDRGQKACQGPIAVTAAFAGVEIWVAPVPPPGVNVRVSAYDAADGKVLASGAGSVRSVAPSTPSFRLAHTVGSGAPVYICLTNRGPQQLGMLGAPPHVGSGLLTVDGRPTGSPLALAMVLLDAHPSSLLSSLPRSFRRAALFRPGWVGAWTFWLLLALVLAAFPLAAVAAGLATRADRDGDGRRGRAIIEPIGRSAPTARGGEPGSPPAGP